MDHRNALVNIEQIRKMSVITSQRWRITLKNGEEFIVSKRQAKNVRDVLKRAFGARMLSIGTS